MIKAKFKPMRRIVVPAYAMIVALVAAGSLHAQPADEEPEVQLPPLVAPEIGIDETLLDDLRPPKKPRLGLVVEELTDQLASHVGIDKGVYIAGVQADGPADKAGLTSGNVITHVGDKPVTSIGELMAAVAEIGDDVIDLTIQGDDGSKTVEVTPIMTAEDPIADQPPIRDLRPRDPRPGAGPSITGDLIRQLMRQFGGNLNGNTIRDLSGLAEELMRQRGGGPRKPAMQRSLKIEINRGEDGRSKVFVDIDGRSFTTDEQHLDALPAEVRGVVSHLLGKGRTRRVFDLGDIRIDLDAQRDGLDSSIPTPDPPSIRDKSRPGVPMDRQLEHVESQLDRLQRQMDELRRSLPRQRPDPREFD